MSDAVETELIHVIADRSNDAEILCWDVSHAVSVDREAPKNCESQRKFHVDDAKLEKAHALIQHANQLLQQLATSTDQLRQCLRISKQNIDDLLARPHVNDDDTRRNRERVPS